MQAAGLVLQDACLITSMPVRALTIPEHTHRFTAPALQLSPSDALQM